MLLVHSISKCTNDLYSENEPCAERYGSLHASSRFQSGIARNSAAQNRRLTDNHVSVNNTSSLHRAGYTRCYLSIRWIGFDKKCRLEGDIGGQRGTLDQSHAL